MLNVTPAAVLAPTFSDSHFVDQPVFTGLSQPTTIRFASDGRAFVAEKSGIVKEFDSIAATTATVVVDLRTVVHNWWDRGLLSLAVDPHFLTGSPYLYLYLVYNAPPGQVAPFWPSTSCPSPPGQTTDGCVVTSELVRVTVNTTTNVASTTDVLIHDWCQQFPSHSGGAMVFDSSGNLIVTGGDGASFTGIDYGQRGGTLPNATTPVTPANPCGDPPGGVGVAATIPTAEGGSLRAQDVRTSGDPTGLNGTIIRVDPATGLGIAANPLAASADANNRRLVANGFRNPFRMTSRPGTDELYVGDVGDQTWEEIDLVNPPANTPLTPTTLPNYGWPCYEGPSIDGAWQGLGTNLCNGLYGQANAVTQPVYAYSHTNAFASQVGPCFVPDGSGRMSSSISGLAFYEGASGASIDFGGVSSTQYKGALFFTDYSRNCLGVLFPDLVTGRPDPSTMQQIASNLSHPVDLVTGAGGDLYYVDLDGGIVHRISYHLKPLASASVTPTVQKAPYTFTLDGSASTDPDTNDYIASYNWYLNGQSDTTGAPDATSSSPTYDWLVNTPGVYTVRLKVITHFGLDASTSVGVDASNAPPVPVIDTPSASLTWTVGDKISFTGHATDTEDVTIPPSGLQWELVIHHCPAGIVICHLHFIQTWPAGTDGVASGSFSAPDHEYPSWLELRLTATDSHGASATTSVLLYPNAGTLTAGSSVPGVHVSVDGTTQPNPATPVTYVRGGLATVNAPVTAVASGKRYRFTGWSDGGSAIHDVIVGTNAKPDVAITAQYVLDAPDSCSAATTASPTGTWLTDYLNGDGGAANTNQDWFRFSLTSARRVVVTAGSLSVDAKLELRSSCSTILATSDHTGNRFEQVTKSLKAGTYYLHVIAKAGTRSNAPYVVRFRVLSSKDQVISYVATRNGATVRVAGEVMNNSGKTSGRITVTATFLNGTKTVATLKAVAFANRVWDGGVTPFVLSGTVPTYTTLRLTAAAAAPVSGPTLAITSIVYSAGPGGSTVEKGTVKNTGSKSARSVTVARTWYGARGEVLGVGYGHLSPSTLAPGKSGTFTITRPAGLTTLQATGSQWRAVL